MKEIEEITDEDLIEVWYAIGGTPHLFEYGKDDLKTVLITGETCNDEGENFGLSLGYYTMAAITDVLTKRGFETPFTNELQQTLKEKDEKIQEYKKDLVDQIESTRKVMVKNSQLQQLLSEKEKEISEIKQLLLERLRSDVDKTKEIEYYKQLAEAIEDVFYRESFPGEPAWEKYQSLKQQKP